VKLRQIVTAVALAIAASPAIAAAPSHRPPAPNGVEWPASFRPYGPGSIWNRRLPEKPRLYRDSDAIVARAEDGADGPVIHTQEWNGGYDVSHPVVFASSSDPVVTAHCTTYCDNVKDYRLHIPPKARPASGPDHHLAVIQPDGTEDDFWNVKTHDGDWRNGETLVYAGGTRCGNFYTGPGWAKDAATAGNACLAGGLVRAAELADGRIDHALFLVIACTDPHAYVFPATNGGAHCTGPGPHVPNGARIWLDLPDSAIDGMRIAPWEKAILRAMHDYGGYVMDVGGDDRPHASGLINVMLEDDAQFEAFGAPSPVATWAEHSGWRRVSVRGAARYIGADPWNPGVDWTKHLHIVDPCYAKGSC
jgi:hypothetical protein